MEDKDAMLAVFKERVNLVVEVRSAV